LATKQAETSLKRGGMLAQQGDDFGAVNDGIVGEGWPAKSNDGRLSSPVRSAASPWISLAAAGAGAP
jgi:hypothetical protein